ncbi:MAG: MFS transporter, partial [Thermoleophilia bacterium]
RLGSRWPMTIGMLLLGGSLLLFADLDQGSDFWTIFPGLILGGLGMALVMTPMSAAAMGSVPVYKAGVAAGVLNTSRQIGGALGIAVMGAIMSSRPSDALAGGATPEGAFVSGFERALLVGAIIVFVGAAAAALTIRDATRGRPGLAAEAPA